MRSFSAFPAALLVTYSCFTTRDVDCLEYYFSEVQWLGRGNVTVGFGFFSFRGIPSLYLMP